MLFLYSPCLTHCIQVGGGVITGAQAHTHACIHTTSWLVKSNTDIVRGVNGELTMLYQGLTIVLCPRE